MYGYIYETTNLINNKKYIGKHKSKIFDINYYGSGIGIKNALKKYGKHNFKVIILEKIYTNQEELNKKEMYYIEKYNAVKNNNYYNQSYGSEKEGWEGYNKAVKENNNNYWLGRHHTKESKLKLSRKLKEYYKKHPVSKEIREKISKANKGKILSEETKNKMRNHKFTEQHKEKIRQSRLGEKNPMYGKHISESTKKKLQKVRKGRKWINNNIIEKWVKQEEIQKYLEKGFVKGRLKK